MNRSHNKKVYTFLATLMVFSFLITPLFITLKLLGAHDLAWVWVLFPLWGTYCLILTTFFFRLVSYLVKATS